MLLFCELHKILGKKICHFDFKSNSVYSRFTNKKIIGMEESIGNNPHARPREYRLGGCTGGG
jgi:hypothetical protein